MERESLDIMKQKRTKRTITLHEFFNFLAKGNQPEGALSPPTVTEREQTKTEMNWENCIIYLHIIFEKEKV